MKDGKDLMTVRQAVEETFFRGLDLGISLGDLAHRAAPKLAGKNEKQISKIWRREVTQVFKEFEEFMQSKNERRER